MARIIAIVCALALALCGMFSCGEESSAPMGFKEISDEALTYHLYVPDEWTADLSTGITSAYYSGIDPSNISVTAFELDYGITSLDDYWAMIEPDLKAVFPDLEYVDQPTRSSTASTRSSISTPRRCPARAISSCS